MFFLFQSQEGEEGGNNEIISDIETRNKNNNNYRYIQPTSQPSKRQTSNVSLANNLQQKKNKEEEFQINKIDEYVCCFVVTKLDK